MQESKTIRRQITDELTGKSVTIFLQSSQMVLTGNWLWDLHADSVFCSDVFMDPPAGFEGVRSILHPEDVTLLKEKLHSRDVTYIEFRIITSYGEVKRIAGENIRIQAIDENTLHIQWLQTISESIDLKKMRENLQLVSEIYERSERFTGTGIWYFNSATNETSFSPQVFRIFGIPPHSLNAHRHTFTSFIHPEDREHVNEFTDKAYKKRLPIHIEYRIRTTEGEKTVLNASQWFFSSMGEEIQCGILQDITEQRRSDQRIDDSENATNFFKQQLLFDEQQANLGHWRVNLVTRKATYSDHFYRIYGLKAQSVPGGAGSFINFIHPEDRQAVLSANKKMLHEYIVPDLDYRIIRSDGRIRYIIQKAKLVSYSGELVMAGTIQDVTGQKMLEKKLEAQVQKVTFENFAYRQAEELAGTGSWIWNVTTGRITCSESFYRFLGLSSHTLELTEKQLLFYIHPDDQDIFRLQLNAVLEENHHPDFEFRFIQRGVTRNMKASFRIMNISDEKLFIGTFQDVSKEHQMQHQLHQRVQLAEALSENISDRVIISDVHNTILLWNRQCEITYKIKKDDAIGHNFFDIFPQIKNEEELRLVNSVLQGETISMKGARSVLGNGYYNLQMLPLWNDTHDEVNGMIHIIHDVTRETELRQHLNERLNFIENLVEASVDRIIAVDRNLNFLVWNQKCEEYYGLKKEHVIGRNVLEIFPETLNTPTYEHFKKVLLGETVFIPATKEVGNELYHEIYLIPVKNEQKEIIAILWILHDLSKEFELRTQQVKTNEIIDALNEGYFEMDEEYRLIHVNSITESFWKKNREELLGRSIFEVFPQTIDSDLMLAMIKSKEEGKAHRGEFISAITGTWIHVSFAPLTSGLAVIFYDIHGIRESANIIKEGTHLLQKINDATPDAITIYNLDLKTPVYLNNCLASWIGCSSEELLDLGFDGRLQLIHPDDRNNLLQSNRKVINALDGDIITCEYRVKTKTGNTIWIRNRSKVFKRDSNDRVTHVLSVLQDFTNEVELRNQLKNRTSFVETMIDASASRIIVFDRNYKVITWNSKCEEEFRTKKEMAIGRNIYDIFPKVKNDEIITDAIGRCLAGENVYIPVRKDVYTHHYSELFFIPLKDASGEVYGVLDIAHDVTKRVNDEAELKQLNNILEVKNRELAQKHEEVNNFAFIASHDLKEPLRKIHTFSDWLLLNETAQLSTTGRNYLVKMNSSVNWMEMLIEDILVLTKINVDLHKTEKVDLNDILQRVLENQDAQVSGRKAVIDASPLPTITANSNQVFHLFKNLISNALKFQERGNIPHLKISSSIVNGNELPGYHANNNVEYFRLSFIDNGFGFDTRYAKKIFRVFQRLHGKHEFEGTGIGLAICKKIMDNHDGFISASSEVGEGSIFNCYFPVTVTKR